MKVLGNNVALQIYAGLRSSMLALLVIILDAARFVTLNPQVLSRAFFVRWKRTSQASSLQTRTRWGDDESAEARLAMQQKLKKRNNLTQRIGYFVPSIHTQLSMNALCKTDMHNYLNYVEALETYHENLRLSFYPKIFEDKPIEAKNLETMNLQYFTDHRTTNWMSVLPIFLWCLVFLWLAKPKRSL